MINKEEVRKDLYEAVNGEWLKTAVIPEDRPTTGGFNDLVMNTEDLLINDFNSMSLEKAKEFDPMMAEFIKFYHMTKDMDKRNKEGIEGVKPILEKLDKINSFADLEKNFKELTIQGVEVPFGIGVSADMKNATKNALYLDVPGIILPDKTYYAEDHPNKAALIAKYREMATKILHIFGYSEEKTNELLDDMFKFDDMIHPHTMSSEELADYTKIYNPRKMEEVEAYTKEFSFTNMFKNLFGFAPEMVIVEQPEFFKHYNELVNEDNFKLYKSWMIVNFILDSTSELTEELRVIGGEYSRFLSGIDKAKSVEKYAYYYATGVFSGVVSVYYGKKYFGEKAKADVREMVVSMIDVYKKRLSENKWLDKTTSNNAITKLNAFEILVGYPDTYKDYYKEFIVDESKTFFENTSKFSKIAKEDALSKLGKDVVRTDWHMPSNMVNAYYDPTGNLICFPAAILQAPFYSLKQTKSENYGGIGAVIGHEISHAFDNNGAKFDEKGNLNNWWTEEDFKTFDDKAKAMIDQFDGVPFGDSKVNGKLTVSENIADAGGLSCSLEALENTGECNLEEFFVNFAKIWCMKAKPEYINLLLSVDVHAPARLRATIQPKNLEEFYQAFGVKEGDPMYLPPEKRVNIW